MSTSPDEDSNADALPKGDYVDPARRGFDPRYRSYRGVVYLVFGTVLLWFCGGLLWSAIDYLF